MSEAGAWVCVGVRGGACVNEVVHFSVLPDRVLRS